MLGVEIAELRFRNPFTSAALLLGCMPEDKTDEVREEVEDEDDIEPESDSDDEPVFTVDN